MNFRLLIHLRMPWQDRQDRIQEPTEDWIKIPAASGIPTILYINAQKILFDASHSHFESLIALTSFEISPPRSVIPADSMATSVPVPIAIPTSAWASAGASLTPSPAIATILPSDWSFFIFSILSCGKTWAITSSIPTRDAICFAAFSSSP